MKILAIIGSYRKGKTIDTLVKKATGRAFDLSNPSFECRFATLKNEKAQYLKKFNDGPSGDLTSMSLSVIIDT